MIKIIEENKEIIESTFWNVNDVKITEELLEDEYQISLTDDERWEILKRVADDFQCITDERIEDELKRYIEEKLEKEN